MVRARTETGPSDDDSKVMEIRFGPLSESIRDRVEACLKEKYSELLRRALQATSLDELHLEEFVS